MDVSIENLLKKPYWLIDVLPKQVPAEGPYNNCKAVCFIDGEYTVKRVENLGRRHLGHQESIRQLP